MTDNGYWHKLSTVALTIVAFVCSVGAEDDLSHIRDALENLQEEGLWGEVVLRRGGVRDIQVVSISGDTVTVREVIGPLHERPTKYMVGDFRSVRELGMRRIAQRRAAYVPSKSMSAALLLELMLPGGGYFYTGENRQGFTLLLFAGAAVATGIATGEDGAAAWVPIAAWTRIASLLHLRDQVRATNRSGEMLAQQIAASRAMTDTQTQDRRARSAAWPIAQIRFNF